MASVPTRMGPGPQEMPAVGTEAAPSRTKVPKGSKENNLPSHNGMGGNCLHLEMTEQEVTLNIKSVCFC